MSSSRRLAAPPQGSRGVKVASSVERAEFSQTGKWSGAGGAPAPTGGPGVNQKRTHQNRLKSNPVNN